MTSGKSPSGPLAGSGGNATLTSMGTPSHAGVVLRGALDPQKRTPLGCSAQATSPPNTDVIAAEAAWGTASAPTVTANAISFLPAGTLFNKRTLPLSRCRELRWPRSLSPPVRLSEVERGHAGS